MIEDLRFLNIFTSLKGVTDKSKPPLWCFGGGVCIYIYEKSISIWYCCSSSPEVDFCMEKAVQGVKIKMTF